MPPTTAAVNPLRPVVEAHEVVDLAEDEPEEDAGRARERRADEERLHDDAVDVDAHHRRRLAVEGRRPHRLSELRPGDEQPERPTIMASGGPDDARAG